MGRLRRAGGLGLVAAACFVLAGGAAQGQTEQKKTESHAEHQGHGGPYEACAKACTHCMRACESCALHCAKLVADGKKEHLHTLGTCLDCSAFCSTAAHIVSRHGPMSRLMCEGCARACDTCGKACQKYSDDAHMQQCARACEECARACREMVQNLGRPREGGAQKKSE